MFSGQCPGQSLLFLSCGGEFPGCYTSLKTEQCLTCFPMVRIFILIKISSQVSRLISSLAYSNTFSIRSCWLVVAVKPGVTGASPGSSSPRQAPRPVLLLRPPGPPLAAVVSLAVRASVLCGNSLISVVRKFHKMIYEFLVCDMREILFCDKWVRR